MKRTWIKYLMGWVLCLLIIVTTWCTVEGAYAMYQWWSPKPSLLKQMFTGGQWLVFDHARVVPADAPSNASPEPTPSAEPVSLVDAAGLPQGSAFTNSDLQGTINPDRYIQSSTHLDAWASILGEAGYIIGGDVDAAVREHSEKALHEAGGQDIDMTLFDTEHHAKIQLAPSLHFKVAGVRGFYGTNIWAQPVVNGPWPGAKGNASAEEFLKRYTLPLADTSTTIDGFRTTLPVVESDKVIIVMGDSVAFGALVNDARTMPSFLQRHYPNIRVINAGIPSSQSDDHYARLSMLLERYKGQVEGVVYVHYENDFFSNIRSGVVLEVENAVAPFQRLLMKYHVPHAVYVAHASVYVTAPDISRPTVADYQERITRHRGVVQLAKKAGFITLDSEELVRRYGDENQSMWAGVGLYTDYAHLSVLGNQYIADTIAATGWLEKSLAHAQ